MSVGTYTMARAYEGAVSNSGSTLSDFCPQGVRHNARKDLNFKFLKNSNWGCQDIKQGLQKYFC
jgi:hypothetical protein